jgi:hypothetical protein
MMYEPETFKFDANCTGCEIYLTGGDYWSCGQCKAYRKNGIPLKDSQQAEIIEPNSEPPF